MASKINIAQFSTNDTSGGAARACVRLNHGFINSLVSNVTYFVKNRQENVSSTKVLYSKNSYFENIENIINSDYIQRNRTDLTNTLFSSSLSDIKLPDLIDFDIINLHWIEKFLSINNLYELVKLNKPIVWTLHDMKAFSGGCHYSAGCEEFLSECKNCLQLVNDDYNLTQNTLHVKQNIFKNANITIVTPSKWLAYEAKRSSLFKNHRVEVIPNGLDTTVFTPMQKQRAKELLGIPSNRIVLTFGAMSHKERRKGFKELVESLELIKEKIKNHNVLGLFFGKSEIVDFPIPTINVGFINSDERLAVVYSAADIFILPSLEDNLPNIILESLSCETPIVAFDTGGAKDIINSSNGTIVEKGNVKKLSEAIYELIVNPKERINKGRKGRVLIEEKYQLHHQADGYIELFQELIENDFPIKQNSSINVIEPFYELIGSISVNNLSNIYDNLYLSKNINRLVSQIEELKSHKYEYILYGNGTVSKLIKSLINEQIIGYVDIQSKTNHPNNLKKLHYDKIIITVLGREDEILDYLVNELYVPKDKIVTINL